jgi:hypothetical protein
VTQPLLMALLTRVGEFSEWGLNTILGLVSKYRPSSEEETYAIMNLLDPVLRTANSGAVLATFKCFTSLTAQMPDMQPAIYQRGALLQHTFCGCAVRALIRRLVDPGLPSVRTFLPLRPLIFYCVFPPS